MRTASGLALVALGAILAFAVVGHPSFLNIQVVGWVIMLTGIVGMAIPRRGYGWLRRRMVLRRGPQGRPVVNRIEEKNYPPYMMLNSGRTVVPSSVTESGPVTETDVPTVADPLTEPFAEPPATEREEARRAAAERHVERAEAEWAAAEQHAAADGSPVPTEEVVEEYVEE